MKPRIVVSRCLEFDRCRWNGMMISSEAVRRLKGYVDFRPVCPECEIGLGVPRDPIRVVSENGRLKLIQPSTGADLTRKMKRFSRGFLDSAGVVDGFILKSRSPSCGIKDVKVHPPAGKGMLHSKGAGFFGSEALGRYGDLAVEDEGRLTNFRIREHFYTKVFAFARFRRVEASRAMKPLVGFHSDYKLLLMAYSQKELRALGRIVANPAKARVDEVMGEYRDHLIAALSRLPRYTSAINAVMHALGYFSGGLSPPEKVFFLEELEKYREGKIPLSTVLSVVKSWITRFGEPYLARQTFFEPYPEGLVEITDSGKGRKL